ncbi:SusC/RagA family TonB-linked outer membrane protein [Niabella sp. CC-SYL272]|uniref:SusC/RagA family TonB-linked outer membrane protein n=1 Tax=Niabella agricola TaxID=2891571 RepID=UPI001F18CCE5|nr:SusC/RagA family TonB-linked outer membrane protein [Niabella agricola]MCF3110399.1 SusC/RagA family TonB-linked outer membrane protein [Niabella agricola]
MRIYRSVRMFLMMCVLVGAAPQSWSQNAITIKGTILDAASRNGLSGATVALTKPNRTLTQTDSAGNFTIDVPLGSVISVTMVGYETKTHTISRSSGIEIEMKSKSTSEQEVVVQAFSQRKKELATGSTVRISGEVVQSAPVSNVMELLQGRVAGVNIQNNTGSPGSIGTINVRGVSTISMSSSGYITPTSPLFVIDGIPVDINSNYSYGTQSGPDNINPLSLIPPEDIESFDFLKDAAAISLYGSRGAYGVVIITTKRGRSKVPIVSYRVDMFARKPPTLLRTLGGMDERLMRINTMLNYDTTNIEIIKANINSNLMLSDSLNPYYNNSTNWQDYFYRATLNHQHNLQISGGDNTFSYKTNIGYYKEGGIIKNTDFERYTLSMQAVYQPVQQFRLTASILGGMGFKGNGSGEGALQTGVAKGASTSSLLPPPSLYSGNSVLLDDDRKNNINKANQIQGNIKLEYEFLKGLRLSNALSYNYNTNNNTGFTPAWLSGNSSYLKMLDDKNTEIYNLAQLQYTKELGDNTFNVSAFNELRSTKFRAEALQVGGFANDQLQGPLGGYWMLSSGGTYDQADIALIKDERSVAFGGLFSYNYKRKYVLDLQYRTDVTSVNGPASGYSHSPGVSARWNFAKEKWLQGVKWLNEGSIRGSWGKSIIPVGNIFDVYGKYTVGGYYNNNPTVHFDFGSVPNVDFVPQVTTTTNMGIDLSMFNNKVNITLEGYYKTTDNQVVEKSLTSSTAFGKYKVNGASVVNRGVEFTLNTTVYQRNDWRAFLNFNFSYDKGTLVALPGGLREQTQFKNDANISVPVVQRVGRNTFTNLMLVNKGVYASVADVPVNPRTGLRLQYGNTGTYFFNAGDPIWVDVNGDYIIDDNDLVPVGNPIPLYTAGFSPSVQYKNFFLDMTVTATLKRDIINLVLAKRIAAYMNPTTSSAYQPIDDLNYWTPINGNLENGMAGAVYPNPFDYIRGNAMGTLRSNQTLFMEDGSYVKINVISLRYRFNRQLIARYGMTQLELKASVNNVYTFSKYSGMNPESVTSLGRDVSGGYPNARGYSLGLSVQF